MTRSLLWSLAELVLMVVISVLVYVDRCYAQCAPSDSCTGGASICGTWLQIPSPCSTGGGEYVNCTDGWPAYFLATHMVLVRSADGTARVLMWHNSGPPGGANTNYWNPTATGGKPRRLPITSDVLGSDNLFCAGHVVLDDGTVFTAGGTNLTPCPPGPGDDHGATTTWAFDPASSDTCGQIAKDTNGNGCPDTNWCSQTVSSDCCDSLGHCLYAASSVDKGWHRRSGNTSYERWYPTCTMLSNGQVLVTSGGSCGDVTAKDPELYDRFATPPFTATGDTTSRYSGPWYPRMHLLNNGKVLHVGPYLAAHVPPAAMQVVTPVVGSSWQNFGSSGVRGGSSAMFTTGTNGGPAMILKTGGFRSSGQEARSR